MIALVSSLVDPSLWFQSGLAMDCLSAVCLLSQCQCPFCFSLDATVCTLVRICAGESKELRCLGYLFVPV
jgi:hypothetical protein